MEQYVKQVQATGDEAYRSVLLDVRSHIRFWLVAVAALALDLCSKSWAFANLGAREERAFIPGLVVFRRSLNDGAVFGSLTGQVGLFIAASVVALGFVFYLFVHTRPDHRVTHIALGLILAGAVGNLYDRARMEADVIRFQTDAGEEASAIGKIVNHESEPRILLGDWPDGANPRAYLRSKVTARRQGVVRDFIKFVPVFPGWVPRLGGQDMWPWVFNVADSALVCGVAALLLSSWRKPRAQAAP